MRNTFLTSLGSFMIACAPALQSAPLYPAPSGGWTYIYNGDQRIVGDDTSFSWLDGTWSHDNNSDAFDGSELGGTFGDGNRPGGVSLLSQDGDTFIRLQDTGDPRDYGYSGDPSNRKVYFGHDVAGDSTAPNVDTLLDDGVTITFRARIPTAAKASSGGQFLIDPLHRSHSGGAGFGDYPDDGDGYVTWDSGKGNFVIRQGGDGTADHPGGALAFSFTQTTDIVNGGSPANFAGLTMNEKNGNVPSGDVDFGEGTATNLVAFDPTDWHEVYIVIHKDPANIATHEVFIFSDGDLTPLVFKLTAGTGADVNVPNFLAMGGPATGQNWALDVDWFAIKDEAAFPSGSIDKLPPSITEVSIPENAMFVSAAGGLSWRAASLDVSPNTLPASGFNLMLNDEDVSSGLSLTGTDSSKDRTATFSGLVANQFYTGEVIVADSAGNKSTNVLSFDTFVEASGVAIESEDYNFSGGQFIDNPQPGDYGQNQGTDGTDFFDTTPGDANTFRPDIVDLAVSTDFERDKFAQSIADDWIVNNVQAGEWLNYTRTFPAGRHLAYLRSSGTANQSLRLDRVSGGNTDGLGTFLPARTGNLSVYKYTQLTDAFGDPISVALSGQQTVRLTALTAANNLQHNLLFFVADPNPGTALAAVAVASPGPDQVNVPAQPSIEVTLVDGASAVNQSSVKLWFDGTDVTASATVTDTADGVSVTYLPGLLQGESVYSLQVQFADSAATPVVVDRTWSFATAAYSELPPALATPIDTGADPGMRWRTHQLSSGNMGSIADAEAALALPASQSVHDPTLPGDYYYGPEEAGGYFILPFINLELAAGTVDMAEGQFYAAAPAPQNVQDDYIPGIPGTTQSSDLVAVEVLTYLAIPQAGLLDMVVNSDDGFKVTVGNATNPQYLTLGSYDGGRSAADTLFQINVTQPGVYLFRLLYFQGDGGASVEWFTVNPNGSRALAGGTQTGSLSAFERRTVAEPELPAEQPVITAPVVSNGSISFTWSNGGELETAPSVDGPWTATGNQSGSMNENVSTTEDKFYRVNRAP